MSRHADTVLSVVEAGTTSIVAASWRRCTSLYNLHPDSTRPPERDSVALRDATVRHDRMIRAATPHLDQLFVLLDDDGGGTNVHDADGLMLACRRGRSHDTWKRHPEKWLGTRLDERHAGTNGVGTALAEERAVAICGNDHFLLPLVNTVCIAAPIYGPDGRLDGCLNAVLSAGAANPTMNRLVQIAVSNVVRRIELEVFIAAFPKVRILLADATGRNPGAVLAVDVDDRVIGASRAARRLLGLDDERLAAGLDHRALTESGTEDLATVERKLIARALARHDGNVSAAAKAIGISRSTFYRKAKGRSS